MTSMVLNQELNGVELYFGEKPVQTIINNLKAIGFRWNGKKLCWYAKQNEETVAEAQKLVNGEVAAVTETIKEVKANKVNNKIVLWNLTRCEEFKVDNNKATKEIAAEVRKHVKARFPFCKFSVTSDYNSIHFYITATPFEKDSVYLKAVEDYCTSLLKAYSECICYDPYGDYGSSYNFYGAYARIDYEYKQTEQTEEIKEAIKNFDVKKAEFEKAEKERKEHEYQEYLKKQEEEHKKYELRQQEEKKQIEVIYNNVTVNDLEDTQQYFVIGSQFAHLNKNNTLDEYIEEVNKGEYELQNVKITRELHFENIEALNNFSNMLLNDFSFIEGTGGSYTNDSRINTMSDYYNMTKEEQNSVEWMLQGIAVYYNNELQFIIDAQGYSYSRYVGLVNNVRIEKVYNTNQTIEPVELETLKGKAESLTDISFNVIVKNDIVNTWNKDNWNQYKELMKAEFKNCNYRLTKPVIQQLDDDMEELKVAMYKLLIEVDGIQQQFKDADLQQGQKITMFHIGDMGGMTTQRITFDSIEYTKYAQYDNAVKITFTPQGKRNKYYNYWYSTILVYDGWLELPENVLNDVEVNNSFVVRKSKYTSCDKQQYDEILNYFESKGIRPVVNTYKPMF